MDALRLMLARYMQCALLRSRHVLRFIDNGEDRNLPQYTQAINKPITSLECHQSSISFELQTEKNRSAGNISLLYFAREIVLCRGVFAKGGNVIDTASTAVLELPVHLYWTRVYRALSSFYESVSYFH